MKRVRTVWLCISVAALAACATSSEQGTLAELKDVPADMDEVYLQDSLERAAESYRHYLEQTPASARTPEAMRRMADLQIEQSYGIIGNGEIVEMAAPEPASPSVATAVEVQAPPSAQALESTQAFEQRATGHEQLPGTSTEPDLELPGAGSADVPAGPREAINTYQQILDAYPNYERNDKVLYQMSRAYDEIGQPDEAMSVMDRLVVEHPHSKFVDEVHFRRGEYYFVRKQYLQAEDAYQSVIEMGSTSTYYELALYKQGWSFYKQEL